MMNFKTRCNCWPWFRFPAEFQKKNPTSEKTTQKYLALGDSYTIGESD